VSRSVGLSHEEVADVYRVALRHRTERTEKIRYQGLYDTIGPARAIVKRQSAIWAKHLIDIPEERVEFDAWVEPVTIINHPGVRA
jgi:hypothetical protein